MPTTYPNPGSIGDVVTRTKIESTWAEAIRDRVVNNFANSTDLNAAIPTPVEGQAAYLADIHAFVIWNGHAWTPPWNMPWGEVGGTVMTSSAQSGFTGDITGLAVTFTAIANRLYIAECECELLPSASTVQIIALELKEGATQLNRKETVSGSYGTPLGVGCSVKARISAPSAGSHTYKVSASISGTGTLAATNFAATRPAFIRVVDDGPAGAPA